jgi:hypothetical protein
VAATTKSNKETVANRSPSATKYNHSSKYTLDHSQLRCTIMEEIEWERFGLAHKDASMIKISKRVS